MARVLLEGLSKVYPGGVTAVRDVELEVADGELVVLVGPSGCGKSTTLRMVAGLEEITAGRLTIGDRLVNEVAARDRNIAMVFQSYALYPHLTVRANLAFGLERRRARKSRARRLLSPAYRAAARAEDADIARRVAAAAETLGIAALLERKPGALSGGQRQRVAVGRALVREPEVFLFDEPLSNLDAKLRVEMRAELSALHAATGATMLYVTHDQEEAMTLGDRLVVMKDGVVQQIGTPREVYDRPANRFVAGFVGTPTMNFLEGSLDLTGAKLLSDGEELEVPAAVTALREHAGRRVVLGVRPDRITFAPDPVRASLACEVLRVEDLGDRRDVHLALPGDVRWIARLDGHAGDSVRPGLTRIHLAMDEAHWFDVDTGVRFPGS